MFKNFFKLILYFLGFVVLGAIASLLIFKIISFEKTVDVPLLVGKDVSEATKLLEDKGLFLKIEGEEYDAKISQGNITRQDIKQGMKIKKGGVINVFVSKGEARFTIPYLEGMDINDARLTLQVSGIEIEKITEVHSDTVEKGKVIAHRPLPGYSTENKVSLLVSLGPYDVSYKCPSFKNMTIEEAKKIADALGLKLIEQGEGSEVKFQKPEAGTIIKRGDSVEVTLGRKKGLWF